MYRTLFNIASSAAPQNPLRRRTVATLVSTARRYNLSASSHPRLG
jgi:hypothetical protein